MVPFVNGTVRDIRTRRAIGHTDDLIGTFLDQIAAMRNLGVACYVVAGPSRKAESRQGIDLMREHGLMVIVDRQFKPDTLWLFEGTPDQLGFAS